MDDFLHNLRSGKLKQSDRSNRPYGDQQYKGGSRRNPMDRRKGHFDNKESSERLNAIKEALELLADTQKRMADAYQARTRAEERKAKAMEVLAKSLYRIANPNAGNVDDLFTEASPQPQPGEIEPRPNAARSYEMIENEADVDFDEFEAGSADDDAVAIVAEGIDENASGDSQAKLSEDDRQAVSDIIQQMRNEGNSWENIARHISSIGYPTLSGKGQWRGAMVRNFHEKMAP